MMREMVYNEDSNTYCFRVTEEQYKELIRGLHNAKELAGQNRTYFSSIVVAGEKFINGIPIYYNADDLPVNMELASDEALELLKTICKEAGFSGTYKTGDKTVYEEYKKKFIQLLEGKVQVYDADGNESELRMRYTMFDYKFTDNCRFYFFDMDEDNLPELCIEGISGTFICKYDADLERYSTWWESINSGIRILGSKKMTYDHRGDDEHFYRLDEDGNVIFNLIFEISYYPGPENKYLVSIPDFEIRMKNHQISESIKQQVIYNKERDAYFLRVTEEQYRKLIHGLHEAKESSRKQTVPFEYFFPE